MGAYSWSTPSDPTVLLANTNPTAEAVAAAPGTGGQASRMDHTHPRLTATATGVLNSSGEATVVFTRLFTAKPGITCMLVEAADNQPISFKIKSWTQDGSLNYTGCVIKGYRSQTIPTNLVTLLLGGVFNLFAGSPSGAEYSLIAVQSSS